MLLGYRVRTVTHTHTPRDIIKFKIALFILHHLDALNIFLRAGFASVRNPNAFVIILDVLKAKIVRLFGVHLRIRLRASIIRANGVSNAFLVLYRPNILNRFSYRKKDIEHRRRLFRKERLYLEIQNSEG